MRGSLLRAPLLVCLAAVLFALSFPNPLVREGLPFLAWIAYVPVFFLVYRTGLWACALWGALYGYLAYLLFNYWLADFHPLAGLVVHGLSLLYMAALFLLFRLAVVAFPRGAFLAHWVIWLAYEYLGTLGFLGYPYGISGYTQWRAVPLIGIADIFGVWGVSALVVFPSAWLAGAFASAPSGLSPVLQAIGPKGNAGSRVFAALRGLYGSAPARIAGFTAGRLPALLWILALVVSLLYGSLAGSDPSGYPKARIALIQPNSGPWTGGPEEFRRDFDVLRRLSDRALAEGPG
ncbi:MAG: hypothetical protein FWD94_08015, partial [Treponema sp.]|nr:hypothetical protein [Treponema sp.]